MMRIAGRGESQVGAKNEDCHQFASHHDPRNKALGLRRIGRLYPIFRDLHCNQGDRQLRTDFRESTSRSWKSA